jgi:hypothetical protein
MNFLLVVGAVIVGLSLYKLIEDISYQVKSSREHKQMLGWKKEYEDNISVGKEVEKNKSLLRDIEKDIQKFQRDYINKK